MSELSPLRPSVRAMAGYVPGEQPQAGDWVKLNTNENPYPPSPKVIEAIRDALTGDLLRKYPDPLGTQFRQTAGKVLGIDPESILIGNGSDDILTIVTRAFVPEGGLIAFPTPGYLLYKTLAEIQGSRFRSVPFRDDWQLPAAQDFRGANLTFLANPNSPSGTMVSGPALEQWDREIDGPVVLDEAYVDFAETNNLQLAQRPNVIVTRTMSKSYSLAGVRFGYGVAKPELIRELVKVKDSYNCDALCLAAATAAIADQDYRLQIRTKILATRSRMAPALQQLGFEVTPSQANFLWCRRHDQPVQKIYEELKKRFILVRLMRYDGYGDGLRITVGTDAEIDRLLDELRRII
ncbi:MAG TPA: histidinol-phosphate transaminase [Gemmataceae bacterium]|jgi:histidinol-phosphate aminotransferase|nr:histidinol-phosphate transaminase [Gemmataceae bacterium]